MAEITITAKKTVGDENKAASISYDFGDNIEEAIEMFGKDVVFTNFKGSAKITAQAAMRRYLEAGLSNEQIGEKMKSWKPGVALERVADPVAALLAKWDTMEEGAKKDLIEALRKKG